MRFLDPPHRRLGATPATLPRVTLGPLGLPLQQPITMAGLPSAAPVPRPGSLPVHIVAGARVREAMMFRREMTEMLWWDTYAPLSWN